MNKLDFGDDEVRSWFKSLLSQGGIEVTFTKVDGSERIMNCTLNENVIPALNVDQTPSTKKRQENQGVLRVWDLDKQSWRSFKWDSIKSFKFEV